jgi:hypothetical protein
MAEIGFEAVTRVLESNIIRASDRTSTVVRCYEIFISITQDICNSHLCFLFACIWRCLSGRLSSDATELIDLYIILKDLCCDSGSVAFPTRILTKRSVRDEETDNAHPYSF